MKKVIVTFTALIVLLIAGVLIIALFPARTESASTSAFDTVKAAAANAIIDAGGFKEKAADALKDNSDAIASYTGLSNAEVAAAIENLDIDSWTAVALPQGLTETKTVSGDAFGLDGEVTLYNNSGYVTVNAYGQDITLAVPESAQQYLPYLNQLG